MEGIVEKLDKINKTLENIYGVLSKPESKVMSVLNVIGLGVGALGFLYIVDLIRRWIIGG